MIDEHSCYGGPPSNKIISCLDSTFTVLLETMVEQQFLKNYKTNGDAKGLLEVIQSHVFGYEEESEFPIHWQRQACWRRFLECKQKHGQDLREHQLVFEAWYDAVEVSW